MALAIVNIRPATVAEWDQVWAVCPYSTFFHSREWGEIWATYTAGKIQTLPKLVEFSDRLSAMIPVCRERRYGGLFHAIISSPAGTYGGWISSDELSHEHSQLLYDWMIELYPNLTWRFNPYDSTLGQISTSKLIPDETQTIDLDGGFDAAVQRWSKGHRKAVRQAQNSGVLIAQAATEDDWKQYYDVYAETLERWGDSATSRYGWDLFKSMLGAKSEHIKLWTARHSGRMIAGCVIFYAKHHVAGWHASTLSDCFELRPQHYLNYEILRDACERGYRWYDLNPSGGHERVKEMKRHFGPIVLATPVVSNVSIAMKFARKSEYIMRRVRHIQN